MNDNGDYFLQQKRKPLDSVKIVTLPTKNCPSFYVAAAVFFAVQNNNVLYAKKSKKNQKSSSNFINITCLVRYCFVSYKYDRHSKSTDKTT